ncbi:MAG: leucine-rich repeat protein [Prevotella sp.]|nr:leucine-rich repeat protein [Prevotella sp.]
MKKLFIFLLALLPMLASADPVEIDGIYYNLDSKTKKAEVTKKPNNWTYSGSVVIPSTVTYDGTQYSVTSIGEDAFYRSSVTSITIPNSVTSIGKDAFIYSKKMTSITIPNSVKTIGDGAFTTCEGLTSIIIPSSVTSIGNGAFNKCSGLTSVTLYTGLTSIGDMAFYECSSLTSVTIPASVTSIGHSPFAGCKKLAYITVKSGNSVYDSRNNCNALIETSSNTLIAGSQNTEIPNSVTAIGGSAFMGISDITSITIPNSVKTIGGSAFFYCTELTSIGIPNSVTTIGGTAFAYCDKLSTVSIGSGVTKIEGGAFFYCSELTDVYCFAENVPKTESTAFSYSSVGTATLYVPKGCFEAYNAATPWSDFNKESIRIVEMADPKVLTGRFSVAADKQVVFSPGNLQYKASINWLAFADNQYDMAGEDNENISSTYDGWIDLFGWGTSGYNDKRPYMTSETDYDYGDGANDLTGTNYDWGVYATIINGGGKAWQTLTADEWTYLLQTREGAADKLGNAIVESSLEGTVGGTKGLVLLPDTWQLPKGLSFTAATTDWTTNTYTASEWAEMEAAGAVFLPASGRRTNGGSIMSLGDSSRGYYWTASASGEDEASYFNFRETIAPRFETDYRSYGFAVRLVRECDPVKVKLSKSKAIIEKGKTLTLKATVTPSDLADKSVTWKSSNTAIATVTSAGKVKGVKTGTATITCTYKATGAKATCKVTVGSVKLDQTEIVVEKTKTKTLKATVYPSTLEDKTVTWTSSNTAVVTVSSKGKVKGVRTGTAIITCTSNATGLSTTCEVTVGSVKLNQAEVTVNKGKTVTLKATVYPSTLEDKTVTWTSSNTAVATVSSKGKVKGVKTGTATITCTSNATGLSTTCEVTVGSVKLDQTEVTVKKGKTVTLKASVYPSTLEDKSVIWESSDRTIAIVSHEGVVKGVKAGTATITCTSVATGLSATCTVTVTSTSGSRSMDGDDDELTGIEENVVAVEPFDVYGLSGRKVLHQVTSLDGLADGVYIVNGKKILKKK